MKKQLMSMFAALLVGSAAGIAVASGPASAATCEKGSGVTVVVGGSISCDSNGGGTASSNFTGVGHSLTYVDTQPGFVCQVDGAPSTSCARTPPSNAYWGLFWSDGKSGTWKYSSLGAGSLKVPQGGWVAFVFQTSNTKKYPAMTPIVASEPKPTTPTAKPKPQPKPTKKPSTPKTSAAPKATTSTPTASATSPTPTPTATTKTPKPTATTPSPTPTSEASADVPVAADEISSTPEAKQQDANGSSGLGWVAGGIGVLLLVGMGVTVWRRRAAGGPS